MNSIEVQNYNLDKTLSSGQTFVWTQKDNVWYGATLDGLIVLSQHSHNIINWQTYPETDNYELVKKYLRLDFSYENFFNAVSRDTNMLSAISEFSGLRLLSQNFYETVISFIISTNKNIPAIRSSIRKLSQKYGQKVLMDGVEYSLFPKLENLADARLDDLRTFSIGYRAEYVKETAQNLLRLQNFSSATQSETDVRETLLKLKGVGPKVADCVLCYSLNFDNVTPLDVWNQRVLSQYYGLDPKLSYQKMREWVQGNFGGYAAWAGQYLFEYIRTRIPSTYK